MLRLSLILMVCFEVVAYSEIADLGPLEKLCQRRVWLVQTAPQSKSDLSDGMAILQRVMKLMVDRIRHQKLIILPVSHVLTVVLQLYLEAQLIGYHMACRDTKYS